MSGLLLKPIIFALKSRRESLLDFRTNRHIVVFESDDWGSIRMPSVEVRKQLVSEGYAVDKHPYEWFDTLESDGDVEALFDVLRQYEDSKGHHPVMTLNYLSQNPDFDRISENGFRHYVGESIADTYKSYPASSRVLDLMKQGIGEGLVLPQCHGREHLNVRKWIKNLIANNPDVTKSFGYRMPGLFPKDDPSCGNEYVVALSQESESEQGEVNAIVEESLRQFEIIWGYKSETYVPCNYCWNEGVEKILCESGVKLIQTSRLQRYSLGNSQIFHHSGQRSKNRILYSVRNALLEPTICEKQRDLPTLIANVESCFRQKKIAIISTHRINYVGGLDCANRDRTLSLLNGLLAFLQSKYKDIEYLSSNQLIDIYSDDKTIRHFVFEFSV